MIMPFAMAGAATLNVAPAANGTTIIHLKGEATMQRNAVKRLHRYRRALAAAALALCMPALADDHTHEAKAAPAAVVLEGQLEFFDRKASPADVAGWYANAGSVVQFRAENWNGDARSVPGATPDKVVVTLEVNGAAIEHRFDYTLLTVAIDGRGAKLEADDVAVLGSFYPMLEKALYESLQGQERNPTLPRAQDALFRVATMYSEAPVGAVIGQRTLTTPKETPAAPESRRSLVPSHASAPTAAHAGEACQVDGGSGVTPLSNPCSALRYRDTYHDANHCYWSTNEAYGENQSSCQGRCGAGCGLFGSGTGAWTVDCHDHDMCETYHDADCGDEWNEAADDYLLGAIRC
jgi:hypothetical protein